MVDISKLKALTKIICAMCGASENLDKVQLTVTGAGIKMRSGGPLGQCQALITNESNIRTPITTGVPSIKWQNIVRALSSDQVEISKQRNKIQISDGRFLGTITSSVYDIPEVAEQIVERGNMSEVPPLGSLVKPTPFAEQSETARVLCIDPPNTTIYALDNVQASIARYTGCTTATPRIILTRKSASMLNMLTDLQEGDDDNSILIGTAGNYWVFAVGNENVGATLYLSKPVLQAQYPELAQITETMQGLQQVCSINIQTEILRMEINKILAFGSDNPIIDFSAVGDTTVIHLQYEGEARTCVSDIQDTDDNNSVVVDGDVQTRLSALLLSKHLAMVDTPEVEIKFLRREQDQNIACSINSTGGCYLGYFMGIGHANAEEEPGNQNNQGNEGDGPEGGDEHPEGDAGN